MGAAAAAAAQSVKASNFTLVYLPVLAAVCIRGVYLVTRVRVCARHEIKILFFGSLRTRHCCSSARVGSARVSRKVSERIVSRLSKRNWYFEDNE